MKNIRNALLLAIGAGVLLGAASIAVNAKSAMDDSPTIAALSANSHISKTALK